MTTTCPHCGFEAPRDTRFCGACGQELTDGGIPNTPPVRRSPTISLHPAGERRPLTVMFCDLVGSTELSTHLDPEVLKDVVDAYHHVATEAIERYEGHVAQFLGDGILAYFGFPQAHEDDAERAVRAGFEVVGGIENHNRQRHGPEVSLAVRVGIHSGPVVVSELGAGDHREQLALGKTPNLAARLQSVAAPGTVIVSAASHKLVEGFFTFAPAATHHLKGMAEAVDSYRVLNPVEPESRFEVLRGRGSGPLVGRDAEFAVLDRLWQQSSRGNGALVVVHGPAGIGKSRLVEEFLQSVAEPHQSLRAQCSPHHRDTALYPWKHLLRRAFALSEVANPAESLACIEANLDDLDMDRARHVPPLAHLLAVPVGSTYQPHELSPGRALERVLDALLSWLTASARRAPVLLVIEDLHWIDATSQTFLASLADACRQHPLLLVVTSRSLPAGWLPESNPTFIPLERLDDEAIAAVIRHFTGAPHVPRDVLRELVAKSDGTPLMAEEITKTVLDSDFLEDKGNRYERNPNAGFTIPDRLHESLLARLDRMGQAKLIAQVAATIGREFSTTVLEDLIEKNDKGLEDGLAMLVREGLLDRVEEERGTRFSFRHALVQEAAYQSLLRSQRGIYHRRIVDVLRSKFPDRAAREPEVLAHHLTEAGAVDEAVGSWLAAGKMALRAFANVEALNHLTRGLTLLERLPASPERDLRELEYQMTRGPAVMALKGFAAPEVEDTYARARAICDQVGAGPHLFPVRWGLVRHHSVRGEFGVACTLAEQLVELAEQHGSDEQQMVAHQTLGSTLFHLARHRDAMSHLGKAIEMYTSLGRVTGLYALHPAVSAYGYAAYVSWLSGFADRALAEAVTAVATARTLTDPLSLAFAMSALATIHHFRHEHEEAQREADAAKAIGEEHEFALVVAAARVLRGWAVAQRDVVTGIADIEGGLSDIGAIGTLAARPHYLTILADCHLRAGAPERAHDALDEAMAVSERTGEQYLVGEIYRVRAVATLRAETGDHDAAATLLERSLEIARRQGARALELRTAVTMTELLPEGPGARGRTILREVLPEWSEGLDTHDLRVARQLVAEDLSV